MTHIDMIIGMQYGGEGKGTVSASINQLTGKNHYNFAIAVSTPQSGHTCYLNDHNTGVKKMILHHIPTAVLNVSVGAVYIPAGSVINIDTLMEDVEKIRHHGIDCMILVDRQVTVVRSADIATERSRNMMDSIGSTQSGTGAVLARRIMREPDIGLNDEHIKKLSKANIHLTSREDLRLVGDILVEASQGMLLSNYNANYPYVTSMPVCPMAALAKIQIYSPSLHVYGVMRYYPIRVGGSSGTIPNETTFEALGVTPEMTTVTQRERRIGEMDENQLLRYISMYAIQRLVINFLNYAYDISDANEHQIIEHVKNDEKLKVLYQAVDNIYVVVDKYGDMVKIK